MALPLKVANRLRLGGAVAAELPSGDDGTRGWVYAEPVVWTGGDVAGLLESWKRMQGSGGGPDSGSRTYHVRCIRLTEWHLEPERNLRDALRERPVPDERLEVRGEVELEAALLRWLPDLNELRTPGEVGYPHPPYRY